MSRPICSAKTCYNSYSNKPLMKFFPFPSDEKRVKQWIKNCQREDLLDVPLDKLSKKHFLCSAHFEEDLFLNPKFKTKFKTNVEPVPTIFHNNFTEFIPKSIQSKISSKIMKNNCDNSDKTLRPDEEDTPVVLVKSHVDLPEGKTESFLCRLCALDISSGDFKNIFVESSRTLKEMIECLLPGKVFEDELPHFICTFCETKVINCVRTILHFEESYYHLKGDSFNLDFSSNEGVNSEMLENPSLECVATKSCDFSLENYSESDNNIRTTQTISLEKSGKDHMIKCTFCPAEFNSYSTAKLHNREVHKGLTDDSLKESVLSRCSKCHKMLPPGKLKFHMESHKSKENQCEYCGVRCKSKKYLEMHLSTHRGDPFCSFCGKEFGTIAQKRSHEKTHSDEGKLCDICGRLFSVQRLLDNHIKNHNKIGNFSCTVCCRLFMAESDLKAHLHSYPFRFPCPICNKEFHLKARVLQHLSTHSSNGLFTCFCGASFNRIGNLKQHRKRKHNEIDDNENVETFLCRICKKKINSKLKLKWHIARHLGDKKPYDCELCEKKFGSIVKYKNHKRTHTGERPFSCSFCSKTFTCKENLKQHEVIHQDIYRYHCSLCDRVFKRSHSLSIHKRFHSGERPYGCSICTKSFYQKHDLLRHLKVHSKHSNDAEPTVDLFSCEQNEKIVDMSELETANFITPLSANSLQLFSVNNIQQVTLSTEDLQLLNLPIIEIPLLQLAANA